MTTFQLVINSETLDVTTMKSSSSLAIACSSAAAIAIAMVWFRYLLKPRRGGRRHWHSSAKHQNYAHLQHFKERVLIVDPEDFAAKKRTLLEGGKHRLQVQIVFFLFVI